MHDSVASLPPRLAGILREELMEDEQVLWADMPEPRGFVQSSWSTALLGLFFTGLAVFAFRQDIAKHGANWDGWGRLLFPGIFAFFGVRFMFAPFWSWQTAKNSVYAVTTRRAIILHARKGRTMRSFEGERLVCFERQEDRHGRGNIIFERDADRTSKGSTRYTEVGFIGLRDARAVDALLRATHQKPGVGTPEAVVGKD